MTSKLVSLNVFQLQLLPQVGTKNTSIDKMTRKPVEETSPRELNRYYSIINARSKETLLHYSITPVKIIVFVCKHCNRYKCVLFSVILWDSD